MLRSLWQNKNNYLNQMYQALTTYILPSFFKSFVVKLELCRESSEFFLLLCVNNIT